MRFSVIVPIYNVEKYLEECVQSVLSQDYEDFEVVLVDDGSLDSCPVMCDSFATHDNRVKVIHKINGGLSDARNAGINLATGDFICFLDSDDFWDDKCALSKMAKVLSEYNSDVVQYYHKKYIQREDRIVPWRERNMSRFNGKDTNEILTSAVINGNLAISACSMAVSRKLILDNGLYFKKGIKTEDLEWSIRLFLCNPKWSYIDDMFYVYRLGREGSITSSVDYKHLCDYCDILEDSIRRIESADGNTKEALMSYIMYHMIIACAHTHKVNLSRKQRKTILLRLKSICKGNLRRYSLGKKVTYAKYVYNMFGFYIMSYVVGLYLIHRKR